MATEFVRAARAARNGRASVQEPASSDSEGVSNRLFNLLPKAFSKAKEDNKEP